MSEIEKLYENAGIEGEWRDYRVKNGKVYNGKNPKNRNIRLCRPCFTPTKQLELIKWLASYKDYTVEIDKFKGIYFIGCREAGSKNSYIGSSNEFEEGLAYLINIFWQDLTPEEQAEIKEILCE